MSTLYLGVLGGLGGSQERDLPDVRDHTFYAGLNLVTPSASSRAIFLSMPPV